LEKKRKEVGKEGGLRKSRGWCNLGAIDLSIYVLQWYDLVFIFWYEL